MKKQDKKAGNAQPVIQEIEETGTHIFEDIERDIKKFVIDESSKFSFYIFRKK